MFDHSFAVMVYGDSPFLNECLDSLVNQTVKSQIYITTSTPSDYITEIAKKYNIGIFTNEIQKGIANDWNFSLSICKTDFLTLAHQDDIYLPNYTEKCLNNFNNVCDGLICFTNYNELLGQKIRDHTLLLLFKRVILTSFMPVKNSIQSIYFKKKMLSFGCPIAAPSVMYHLKKMNDFRFSDQFSINMDWDAWYRLAKMDGSFIYCKEILLVHRIHVDSATTAGLKSFHRQNEDFLMFSRFWPGYLARAFSKMYAFSYKSNNELKN
jgi:hypothetical protein